MAADAGGTATLTFQAGAGVRALNVSGVVLNVTPAVPRPRCDIYVGLGVGAAKLVGSKRAGDSGTMRGAERVGASELLIVQWTGAAPGAVCTANVTATTE